MKSIFRKNTFRLIGVFANATLKEMVAAQTEAKAYARVGQRCDLPLRLEHLLGPVDDDEVTQAENRLKTVAADYSADTLLWFERGPDSACDVEAIRLLDQGHTAKALACWQQRTDHAAAQNIFVAELLTERYEEAVRHAQQLFTKEEDIRLVLNTICTEENNVRLSDVLSLVEQFPLSSSSDSLLLCVVRDMLTTNVRQRIENHLELAEITEREDAEQRSNVTALLVDDGHNWLPWLGKTIGVDSAAYQMLSDQMAGQLYRLNFPVFIGQNVEQMYEALKLAANLAIDESLKVKTKNALSVSERLITTWRNHTIGNALGNGNSSSDESFTSCLGYFVCWVLAVLFFKACLSDDRPTKKNIRPSFHIENYNPVIDLSTFELPDKKVIEFSDVPDLHGLSVPLESVKYKDKYEQNLIMIEKGLEMLNDEFQNSLTSPHVTVPDVSADAEDPVSPVEPDDSTVPDEPTVPEDVPVGTDEPVLPEEPTETE